ncbi:hypothetical protein QBC44DRAFT_383825 [Cladorrhinum sp. PSN332]|nr:hypothetical protein QBC44DRAFT_383825 [Cladorrhinum sp. PSN332]
MYSHRPVTYMFIRPSCGRAYHVATGSVIPTISSWNHAIVTFTDNVEALNIGGGAYDRKTQDDAKQGLAVFDMLTLEWKEPYDTNAGPYERIDAPKEWYAKG